MNLRLPPFFAPALALALLATPALAGRTPTGALKYRVNKRLTEGRPEVTSASIKPQGDDFALRIEFDSPPTGAECKDRCARASFLLDTDDEYQTGLQQGPGKPPTGANLGISVEGSAEGLKVTVRQFSDEDRLIEDGDLVQQLDLTKDPKKVKVSGNVVTVLVDASSSTLPANKVCRFVFLPQRARPVSTQCVGMSRPTSSRGVAVERGRRGSSSGSGAPRNAADATGGTTSMGGVKMDSGGSAYDPNEKPRWGEGG